MQTPRAPAKPSDSPLRRASLAAAAGFVVLAAYANSFTGAFVFDDRPGIVENPSLRQTGTALFPPANTTLSGRPVANLTLALNHAWGGLAPGGYHAVNLLIHALAVLALFGVVRRTLESPRLQERFGRDALPLAAAAAALWGLHPLNTEAVTYVVQRTESLAALFCLLTLYAFIRGATDGSRWHGLAVIACLLGMGSKETMVAAPVVVLLYDRIFLAGSFREALGRRWPVHAGLAATWLVLAWLVAGTGGARDGSAGFGQGIGGWDYLMLQGPAIVRYLRLALWPHPLVFDYGAAESGPVGATLPFVGIVAGLLAGAIVLLRRAPAAGFAATAFFVLLAPSSSFVPVVTQGMAEHRMYLPLAALVALAVTGAYLRLGRPVLYGCAAAGLAWGALTWARNGDYRSELALWTDTVAKRPQNPRAHNNLGTVLLKAGLTDEAAAAFETAVRLKPGDAEVLKNLGDARLQLGRPEAAVAAYAEALRVRPALAGAEYGLGNALLQLRRPDEAAAHYRAALRADEANVVVRGNLGSALAQAGRTAEAIAEFEAVLRRHPDYALVHDNLGNLLLAADRVAEALPHYEAAVRLGPGDAWPHFHLGVGLALAGRRNEARAQFEEALRLKPDLTEAREMLQGLPAR